jgi:hypothetical protein
MDWLPIGANNYLPLRIIGLNMDVVYENFIRQIAGDRLGDDGGIKESVENDARRQRLKREIAALKKKVQREKQFNRQVEINAELKRLKYELEEMK